MLLHVCPIQSVPVGFYSRVTLESKYVRPEGRPQETGHSPPALDMSLSLLPLSLFTVLSLHLFESHGSVSLHVYSIYRVFILSCP